MSSSQVIALITVACVFGGALLGLWLQRLLPKHHLSEDAKDVIKLGAGVIATITALVLGLLVSSAKGTFDGASARIVQTGTNIIILDGLLKRYGPETAGIREKVRAQAGATIHRIWPSERTSESKVAIIERQDMIEVVQGHLRELTPATDAQRKVLAEAEQVAGDIARTRWMFVEESQNELPKPFLIVLVFWLTVLFLSFGLFAPPRNATILVALFVCACSMAAAIFLVLEMNRPLDGVIKVSSAPLRKALDVVGR